MMKNKRTKIQIAATIFYNSYLFGFLKGKIYTGPLKQLCVPGLNCYSCPGAVGSCPIGALQATLGGNTNGITYYVWGLLIFFGVSLGRLVCGFLCPFGFLQDLLYKIKTKKRKISKRFDHPLRYLKYFIFAYFVVFLSVYSLHKFGVSTPYFCKWICPVGTLEGGIPLVLMIEPLRSAIGFLYAWKILLLIGILLFSVFTYRPFCKYICPLGAFYGLFNKISIYQMKVDKDTCIDCMLCEQVCKMNVSVRANINSAECIRCGDCLKVCPTDAISAKFTLKD